MNHVTDTTPEGMKTEEGQARVKMAMAAQEEARQEAIRNFKELMRAINWNPGKQELIKIVAEWHNDEETAKDVIDNCFSSLKAIDEVNEEFLNAVAGRN